MDAPAGELTGMPAAPEGGTDGGEIPAPSPSAAPFGIPFGDDGPGIGEEPGLQDQIYTLLADGPMSLRELRDALPGFQPSSVSNTCTQLKAKGLITSIKRSVWQRTDS